MRVIARALLMAGVVAVGLAAAQGPPTGLLVRIPAGIEPEAVHIYFGQAGVPPVVNEMKTRPGIANYVLPVSGPQPMTILMYVPGYQVVTRELSGAELASTLEPKLTPLAMVRMNGRLVDSRGRAVVGQELELSYNLLEAMPYFGYLDGGAPSIQVARSRTDANGAFAFDVPAFDEDPFFRTYSTSAGGSFQLGRADRQRPFSFDDNLWPSRFATQATYANPFVVVQTEAGVLSGRLGRSFLRQHDLGDDLSAYRLDLMPGNQRLGLRLDAEVVSPDGREVPMRAYNALLKADGTFEVALPPGVYNVKLSVLDAAGGWLLQRTIAVEQAAIVREGERHVIERP